MEYAHSVEQALEYANAAMNRVRKEGLAPNPDIFKLWYIYYSGQAPEISRAIDVLIANKQKITEARCKELHQRFLSTARDEEKVRHASSQIHMAIKDVTGVVHNVKTATNAYNVKLGDVSGMINDIDDSEQLKKVLHTVMSDTEAMIEHNHQLEVQLNKSSVAMEELQKDLASIRKEALTDGLTGLANRKSFDSEMMRVVTETKEKGSVFSLLMVDIDHFKNFNDHFGHQIGDQVLRLVARCLTDGVKGRDITARYGGEEFAIILPDTPLNAGVVVGESLRKTVAMKEVVNRNTGEKLSRITMSVGVAEYSPGEDIHDLIGRADAALYTAKHNGRNQVAAAPTPGKIQERAKE